MWTLSFLFPSFLLTKQNTIGHGYHNDVGGLSNVGNRDALLSPLGVEQSIALCSELRGVVFDMVVVSPMRRVRKKN